MNYAKLLAAGALSVLAAACSQPDTTAGAGSEQADAPRVVNVYSARHYRSDAAIYAAFTEQTGIEVNLIEASGDQLIERVRADGPRSPADVIITTGERTVLNFIASPLLDAVRKSLIEE